MRSQLSQSQSWVDFGISRVFLSLTTRRSRIRDKGGFDVMHIEEAHLPPSPSPRGPFHRADHGLPTRCRGRGHKIWFCGIPSRTRPVISSQTTKKSQQGRPVILSLPPSLPSPSRLRIARYHHGSRVRLPIRRPIIPNPAVRRHQSLTSSPLDAPSPVVQPARLAGGGGGGGGASIDAC
ncbi:uncharacterized protein LY79DRAFT_217191 [Colletotrichum navitas]|uniref:Uncharacterized protein n=1 Tax=Colletotrichum navitas TaxID=681940 RepID=A0AAD8PI90_9PEZI|nr:uncharacterized protein LY79DRAFT_217191 [Colletotrichum navitas]KAK1561447.1 hypothetical protein LY79DRAFT_217191 [Colletotrichum navitas]